MELVFSCMDRLVADSNLQLLGALVERVHPQ